MGEELRTEPLPDDLLTVAYEGITVARIDARGEFYCYDRPKMVVTLRDYAEKMQQAMWRIEAKPQAPKKGDGRQN